MPNDQLSAKFIEQHVSTATWTSYVVECREDYDLLYREVREKLKAAAEHIRFTLELCLEQHSSGRMFLFEHPNDAATWTLRCMQDMMNLAGVYAAKFDFCMLGCAPRTSTATRPTPRSAPE